MKCKKVLAIKFNTLSFLYYYNVYNRGVIISHWVSFHYLWASLNNMSAFCWMCYFLNANSTKSSPKLKSSNLIPTSNSCFNILHCYLIIQSITIRNKSPDMLHPSFTPLLMSTIRMFHLCVYFTAPIWSVYLVFHTCIQSYCLPLSVPTTKDILLHQSGKFMWYSIHVFTILLSSTRCSYD